ncbi:MAG: hypothetical protein V4592_12480 [Bacteroidota bacterium]
MKFHLYLSALLAIFFITSCKKTKPDVTNPPKDGFFAQAGGGMFLANDMALDTDNNIYVAGQVSGTNNYTINFDDFKLPEYGYGDSFLAKYNDQGKAVWAKSFGGKNESQIYSVATDKSQNVYVAGTFVQALNIDGTSLAIKPISNPGGSANETDMFLAKFDINGKLQWLKQVSGLGIERPTAIAVDNSGKVYVTGYHYRSIYFDDVAINTNGPAYFLACYTTDGQLSWGKVYGDSAPGSYVDADIYAYKLKLLSDGSIIVAGSFIGSKVWGLSTITSNGNQDVFISKYTTAGNLDWVKTFGNTADERTSSLTIDNQDNIYLSGDFKNTVTIGTYTLNTANVFASAFLAKYDKTGAVKMAVSMANNGDPSIEDIKSFNDKVFVTGTYQTQIALGDTILKTTRSRGFIARLSADGKCEHADNLGTEYGSASKIAVNSNGYTLLYGFFNNPFTFFDATYTASAGRDLFLLKYKMK